MNAKLKAGLIVGGALLILNLGTGLICQLCPMALSIVGGALTGWLALKWAAMPPKQPPADGAIAGGLAGLGGFVGQILSVIINTMLFARGGFVNPLTGEQLVGQEQTIGVLGGIGIWGCGGLVAIALAAGAGALMAMVLSDRES